MSKGFVHLFLFILCLTKQSLFYKHIICNLFVNAYFLFIDRKFCILFQTCFLIDNSQFLIEIPHDIRFYKMLLINLF